jgi:hypothetical protein
MPEENLPDRLALRLVWLYDPLHPVRKTVRSSDARSSVLDPAPQERSSQQGAQDHADQQRNDQNQTRLYM